MMDKQIFVVDIDNTICTQEKDGKYENAKPFEERIKKINKLFEEGHTIIYFTARGMGRFKNNTTMAEIVFFKMTEQQLKEWGCKYHELRLGKPAGSHYIDDKAINDKDFFDYAIRNFEK